MEVCPLSRGVMLPLGSTPIPAITAWLSLFPSSSTHSPISLSYGLLSLWGRAMGLPRSAYIPLSGLGSACSPVAFLSACRDGEARTPSHVPFGSSLSAPLACRFSRRLSAVHFSYPYRPHPSAFTALRWQCSATLSQKLS